jgi:hypothetical protein
MDALGIKDGSYPRTLLDEIRSTLDLTELLAINNALETAIVNSTPSAVAYFQSFTVPQGETWLVAGTGASYLTGAAELMKMAIVWRANIGGAASSVMRKWDSVGADVAGLGAYSASVTGPFWLPSGSFLGFVVERITTAGSISVNQGISFLRCRR